MHPREHEQPSSVAHARRHQEALRALARRLHDEFDGVTSVGRILAAAHRADRALVAPVTDRPALVELKVRRLLEALVSQRARSGTRPTTRRRSTVPGPAAAGPAKVSLPTP